MLIDWIHNKAWFILHHKWDISMYDIILHLLLKFHMGDCNEYLTDIPDLRIN
jgi:hypothetical protein